MNLQELQNIIELAKCYSSELSGDMMIFIYKIYLPVSDAIANNNKIVIGYLLNCEASDRLNILEAIEDGAKRLNILKSHKLLNIVKKDKKAMAG